LIIIVATIYVKNFKLMLSTVKLITNFNIVDKTVDNCVRF